MFGIQETIARCFEYHDDFLGNMPKSVDYAKSIYLDPKRYLIQLYEHLYPQLRASVGGKSTQ